MGRKTTKKHQPQMLAAGLYITATPIGNLSDISLRALEVLRQCDGVICEDSRITARLFARHQLPTKPMLLYHDHSSLSAMRAILAKLEGGAALALVSDAGTPLVADPGVKLVRAALEKHIPLFALPGPCAALAGLVVSGLAGESFAFLGFPPRKNSQRRQWLERFAGFPGALIFYEAPPRLAETLEAMASLYGARNAALLREATKRHEEVIHAPLPQLAARFAAQAPPKGEITLVVAAPDAAQARAQKKAQRKLWAKQQRGLQAFQRGLRYEVMALWWLRFKGFRLLKQRWRSRAGEIDLIMRRGQLVIFVEVKARQSLDEAAHALAARQKKRLRRSADHWLQTQPHLASCTARFDIVLFSSYRWQHLPDAWQ